MSKKSTSTPSEYAKSMGFKTLTEVARLSGTPSRTLHDWFCTRPDLFHVVLLGCKIKRKKERKLAEKLERAMDEGKKS